MQDFQVPEEIMEILWLKLLTSVVLITWVEGVSKSI